MASRQLTSTPRFASAVPVKSTLADQPFAISNCCCVAIVVKNSDSDRGSCSDRPTGPQQEVDRPALLIHGSMQVEPPAPATARTSRRPAIITPNGRFPDAERPLRGQSNDGSGHTPAGLALPLRIRARRNSTLARAGRLSVYGPLLVCQHSDLRRVGTTAHVYPASM